MALISCIVDSREPEFVKRMKFGGASVAVTMLDAGDLLCATDDGNLLAIERKTSSDFLNTLRDDRRLFLQIGKLHEVSPQWSYLVITGTLHSGPNDLCVTDERLTGWSWASVAGALLTVQELGVHVLQVASDFDYESAILRLSNRSRDAVRVAPARDVTIVSEPEQILAALPGIGSERASLLARQFSPAMAISWLTCPGELFSPPIAIPGIGEGTRARVRRALGLAGNLSLDIVTHERNKNNDIQTSDTRADKSPAGAVGSSG